MIRNSEEVNMSGFTEEQVEEMVQEAVAKTEKSFGGTFKRLKSENEELQNNYEAAVAEYNASKNEMEKRINELEPILNESKKRISELAIESELQKQIRVKGPIPKNFLNMDTIQYSDDPEILSSNVTAALEEGRKQLENVLKDIGISVPQNQHTTVNPTNPPSRDTKTAGDLKNAASKEVLNNMMKRGLLR